MSEYSLELHYYPVLVKLDRYFGSCNTLNKICIPNKTEDLNLSVFNMITGINDSKTLTKDTSWECLCRSDETKCNSNQWWNNDKCWCGRIKHHICEKDYIFFKKIYLASSMDHSVITCEAIIYAEETNFNEKKYNL